MQVPPIQASIPTKLQSLITNLEEVCQVVTEIAVRVLFVASAIWLASATLPLSFHAVFIPFAGVGATFLAAFFYIDASAPQRKPASPRLPLLRLIADDEEVLPLDAPRGISNLDALKNQAQNCAFNSLVQFVLGDPTLLQWLRNPITDMAIDEFMVLLNAYGVSADCVANFQARVEEIGKDAPATSWEIFNHLELVDENVKALFNKIVILQDAFTQFFDEYDREDGNLNSQALRVAMSQISEGISDSAHHQEDAEELLSHILDLLPISQKVHFSESYHFSQNDIIDNQVQQGNIQLAINDDKRIENMLRAYCNERAILERDGEKRETKIKREFLLAPSALRFQIKRFANVEVKKGWASWFYRGPAYRQEKIQDPVMVPEEIAITLIDGSQRQFRLSSFINHQGDTISSGHYVAGRVVNRNKYLVNDLNVTLAGQQEWDQQLQQAYLLCFVPAEEQPS